jgi:hypothetical protein
MIALLMCLAATLTPGTGWTGVVEPTGTGTQAMARWNAVPYQVLDGKFEVGVVAFHPSGIARVEFSQDGGPVTSVTKPTWNPRSNTVEYWITVDTPGEVRAVVYPKAGISRVLGRGIDTTRTYEADTRWRLGEHSMLFVKKPVSRKVYIGTSGSDTKGLGTVERPYATLTRAIEALRAYGEVDGGTVVLLPGVYGAIGMPLVPEDLTTWFTIEGPGAVVRSFTSRTQIELLRFKDVKFLLPAGSTTRLFYGGLSNGSRYLWLDNVTIEGEVRATNVPVWRDLEAFFATDVTLRNNARGFGGNLVRNVLMESLGDDAFTEGLLVVNCELRDVDKYASNNAGAHADVYQFYDTEGIEENTIVYNLVAVDRIRSQGVFAGTACREIALVNVQITQEAGNHCFRFGDVDALYVKGCVFNGHCNFDGQVAKNTVVEGTTFIPSCGNLVQPGVTVRP